MSQLGKIYNIGFQLNASRGSGFDSTFSKAQQEFARLGQEIQGLHKVQSDISAYEKQQAAVERTTAKLDNLRQQEALLVTQINAARNAEEQDTAAIAALEREKLKLEQQIGNTESALERQNLKLDATSERLQRAGVNTGDLTTASARLSSQLDELRKEQEEAAKGAQTFGEKAAGAVETIQQVIATAGIAASLNEIYQVLWECADASTEFGNAMAGVKRTVGGSDAEIAALGENFKDLSTDIPIFTSELAKIAETAGQLGIAQSAVEEFTKVMAMLSTTTDLTADTAATMLAQFANITGVTDYQRLGSAVADLGDATATTASKVVEMSQGMAAAAHLAGMSETDILGIAAAVGSLGIESQAGSTAMSTLIQTLYKAVETGDGLEDFADVANMSAAEFKTAWGEDAVGAMDAFIKGLNDTERNGRSAIVILDELGITNVRQTKAILGLASAGDLLSNTITQANAAWDENTALQAKADVMYGTTQSKLVMMQNAYNNLKIAVGDNYTPALEKLYEVGADVLSGMTQFVQEHPALVKAVTAFIGVAGAAVTAITAVNAAVKAFQLLNLAALFTGPVGGIILAATAVAGVTAAVVGLVSAANDAIPSVKELTEAARDMQGVMNEASASYEETASQTLAAAQVAETYIAKLEELGEGTEAADNHSQTYLNTLALLSNAIPELSSYINLETGAIEGGTEALRKHTEAWKKDAEAQAYQEYLNSLMGEYNSVMTEAAANSIKLTEAEIQLENIQSAREAGLARMNELERKSAELAKEGLSLSAEEQAEYYQIQDALVGYTSAELDAADAIRTYTAAVEKDKEALAEAEAVINDAQEAYDRLTSSAETQTEAQQAAADALSTLEGTLTSARAEIDLLADAYGEAYKDAYESISGQMGLFEEMSVKVDTSVGDMIASLESQVSYMATYSENLRKAAELGLSEGLLSQLSDGSTQSAAYLQAIVDGGEEKIEELNAAFAKVEEGKVEFSDTVAEMQTGLEEALAEMEEGVRASVEAMELPDEAAESARNTIQAFIDEAEDMLPWVQSAYAQLGQAATNALGSSTRYSNTWAAQFDPALGGRGYASGTSNAPPGWAWVGEKGPELIHMRGGETVLPSEVSREFAILNEFYSGNFPGYASGTDNADDAIQLTELTGSLPYDSAGFLPYSNAAEAVPGTAASVPVPVAGARSVPDAMPAPEGGDGAPVTVEVHIHLEGNVTQEAVQRMDDYVRRGELKAAVKDAIKDAQAEARRRYWG